MQWSLISQVATILFLEGGNSKGKRWRRQKKKKKDGGDRVVLSIQVLQSWRLQTESFNPGGQWVNPGGQSRDQQSCSSR